jgi:hypothetical protein
MRALPSEHGPMRFEVRIGRENPGTIDALRILARLLVAEVRKKPGADLALHPDRPLSVPRGVAS